MRAVNIFAALALVAVSGCDLYFGGGDDDVCAYRAALTPVPQYRDPYTGLCQPFGDGAHCEPDACGYCTEPATDELPDWGMCNSECSGLDEQTCFATAGCFAALIQDPYGDEGPQFWGCWDSAPSGPIQGECALLSAHDCSRHDDCVAVYNAWSGVESADGTNSSFTYCAPEPAAFCLNNSECGADAYCDSSVCYQKPCPSCPNCGTCADTCYGICVPNLAKCEDVDCMSGTHCEEQCYSTDTKMYCEPVCVEDTSCANVDCFPGTTCAEVCGDDGNDNWTCHATCVPDHNPGECTGSVWCLLPDPPACPTGTTPGIRDGCYTGYCIPNAQCTTKDPGECSGDVFCLALPPQCPTGTVPGVQNGCYTGYCIPQSSCGPVPCETMTSESACLSRTDCKPIYTGDNCTCTANGCSCEDLTYARCEAN
jgi:hypothetical protein